MMEGGGMSYTHLFDGYSHYFYYLEDIKNVGRPWTEIPLRFKDYTGGVMMSCKIDDKAGSVFKSAVLDINALKKKVKGYQYATDRVVKLNSGELIFEVYKKKKEDVLVKVSPVIK